MNAIFKIALRPNERTTFDTWAEQIEIAGADLPKLELHIAPEDERIVFAYGAEGSTQPQNGMFSNTEEIEFKLKPSCTCYGFKIENGLLEGDNVVHTYPNSKVKEQGSLGKVKAIVLHRTVGSNINGAVSHSKGTHFYIEGGNRGINGQIYQAINLTKSSSHIYSGSSTQRIARTDVENNNSIGIEVVGRHYGKNKKGEWINEPKKDLKLSKKYTDNGGDHYWEALTNEQVRSVVCLIKQLMDEYNLSKEDILTHEGIQKKTASEGMAVLDAVITKL